MTAPTPGPPTTESPDENPPSVRRTGVRLLVVLTAVLIVAAACRYFEVPSTQDGYRAVVTGVHDAPGWLRAAVEASSELGLIALAVALLLVGWRARGRGSDAVARVLAAGVGALTAYLTSEAAKVLIAQERPCRALPEVSALVTCPGHGDWALPSNHATIAGALVAALVFAAPRAWPVAAPVAVLVASSRVALGVHYPHDVATGLFLGAGVATLTVLALHNPMGRVVRALTAVPLTAPLLADRAHRPRPGEHR